MDKSTPSSLASSVPPSSSKKRDQRRFVSLHESYDDPDSTCSILAAAIGLTSLGAQATSYMQKKNDIYLPTRVFTTTATVVPQQKAIAENTLKLKAATPRKRKEPTASAMNESARPQSYRDQLYDPMHPPSQGIETSRHPLSFPSSRYDMVSPSPNLVPNRPTNRSRQRILHLPPSSSELCVDIHADNPTMPQKRQKINQFKQPQPLRSQHQQQQGHQPSFPEILHKVLSSPSNQHIISWLLHGQGFVIHDKKLFTSQILPIYFGGGQFTSFTRRLKRWNFERVPRYPNIGTYRHQYFVRDRPELVRHMVYRMDAVGDQAVMEGSDEGLNGSEDLNQNQKESVKNEQSDAEHANILDDGGALEAAAMEVHRRQPKLLLSKSKESDNGCQQHQDEELRQVNLRLLSLLRKQSKLLRNQSGMNPKHQWREKPSSVKFNFFPSRYQEPTSLSEPKNPHQREQDHVRQRRQFHSMRHDILSHEAQQERSSQTPMMARRNTVAAFALANVAPNHRSCMTTSHGGNGNEFLSRYDLDNIHLHDNDRQLCSNDIKRQILADMSCRRGSDKNIGGKEGSIRNGTIVATSSTDQDPPTSFMDRRQIAFEAVKNWPKTGVKRSTQGNYVMTTTRDLQTGERMV